MEICEMCGGKICSHDENKLQCPCEYIHCPRYGICCQCIRFHLSRDQNPICIQNKK